MVNDASLLMTNAVGTCRNEDSKHEYLTATKAEENFGQLLLLILISPDAASIPPLINSREEQIFFQIILPSKELLKEKYMKISGKLSIFCHIHYLDFSQDSISP